MALELFDLLGLKLDCDGVGRERDLVDDLPDPAVTDLGGMLVEILVIVISEHQPSDEFGDPISDVSVALTNLDHTVELINAHLTLAAPHTVERSEVIRTALRSASGQSEIGLKSADVLAMVLDFQDSADLRDSRSPADASYDFHVIDDIINPRIDVLHDEIERAIALPQESAPYIEWMLAELNDLCDGAFSMACDDAYQASGTIQIDAMTGVLANDVLKEYRVVEIDHASTVLPANGQLTLQSDGSFEYTPEAGFSGQDSFAYALVGTVIDTMPDPEDGEVVSNIANVVIHVGGTQTCPPDFTIDGMLDFLDVSLFLQYYGAVDPLADLTDDGRFDFFDISLFIQQFGAGCP